MFLNTNVYIPYDVSFLGGARDEMLRSVGVATNVGILLFGVLCGIFLIIMIVRKFMR